MRVELNEKLQAIAQLITHTYRQMVAVALKKYKSA